MGHSLNNKYWENPKNAKNTEMKTAASWYLTFIRIAMIPLMKM